MNRSVEVFSAPPEPPAAYGELVLKDRTKKLDPLKSPGSRARFASKRANTKRKSIASRTGSAINLRRSQAAGGGNFMRMYFKVAYKA
jgi:hypothetical protein